MSASNAVLTDAGELLVPGVTEHPFDSGGGEFGTHAPMDKEQVYPLGQSSAFALQRGTHVPGGFPLSE